MAIAEDRAILADMLASRGDFAAAESLSPVALAIQRERLPAPDARTAGSSLLRGREALP